MNLRDFALGKAAGGGGGGESFAKLIDGSIVNAVIPSGVTTIHEYAFYKTALTNVSIPTSVTSIEQYAFCSCSNLKGITIPNSVTSLGKYVVSGSALTSIEFPSSVTNLPQYCCNGCASLVSAVLPSSITYINNYAFNNCSKLASLTCHAVNPPTIGSSGAFAGMKADCAIYVPAESVNAYKTASKWSDRASYIQAIPE